MVFICPIWMKCQMWILRDKLLDSRNICIYIYTRYEIFTEQVNRAGDSVTRCIIYPGLINRITDASHSRNIHNDLTLT